MKGTLLNWLQEQNDAHECLKFIPFVFPWEETEIRNDFQIPISFGILFFSLTPLGVQASCGNRLKTFFLKEK